MLLTLLWLPSCRPTEVAPTLHLETEVGAAEFGRFEAYLGTEVASRLRSENLSDETWPRYFAVYPATSAHADRPPMLGDYRLLADRVQFRPAFPLEPGTEYRARWSSDQAEVESTWLIPRPATEPTRLDAIYPSSSRWPANLLRIYLQFSASMSRQGAVESVEIVRQDGTVVAAPFVAPETSLWNPASDRLTLLLDPGRTKRGVGPNLSEGPVLTAGERYEIVVHSSWEDGRGRPLDSTVRREFEVVGPDRESPDPDTWTVDFPQTPIDPLVIVSASPLDRVSFEHRIAVLDRHGERVAGLVSIEGLETRWIFHPRVPWLPGQDYEVRVSKALEDPSGNSLWRRFEEPLVHPESTEPADQSLGRFSVRSQG